MLIELFGGNEKMRCEKINFYFIAVNYNGSNYTKEYVESVVSLNTKEDNIQVIIVDNNSKEEDKINLSTLEKNYNNLKIIWLSENLGYFKGLNKGIKSIKKARNTTIIAGNNDLTFDLDFLLKFKEIEYDKDVLVIAPNIITKEGRQQNPHVIEKVSKIEKLKASIYNSNYYVGQTFRFLNQSIKKMRSKPVPLTNSFEQMKIKRGIGACYILTPNFFKHFTKLDDRVFMWGEEALLSNQVESVGGATLYDPTIKIIHHESASVKSIESKRKYYTVKESYKIYKKYL